jgi:adenosine deaminase
LTTRALSDAERAFIRRMPKAELHVHLEGSVHPETLLDLGRQHGVAYPFDDLAGARDWFRFRDFPHFVEVYLAICNSLLTDEDYARVVWEIGRDAGQQNIQYLEVTFAPTSPLRPRLAHLPHADVVLRGLRAGARRALDDFGVRLQFIIDPVRTRTPEEVKWFARWLAANYGAGLAGFGLGGLELGYPAGRFADTFALLRDAGLPFALHAGETDGPASVRDALAVGAWRIGHGVRASEEPALVRELAERGIVIEVSPTSNICLGVFPTYDAHPIRALHDAGVQVTVNSDDPPMFGTTLTDEYLLLAERFGFSLDELVELSLRAARAAFLPQSERDALACRFAAQMADLRQELGLPTTST